MRNAVFCRKYDVSTKAVNRHSIRPKFPQLCGRQKRSVWNTVNIEPEQQIAAKLTPIELPNTEAGNRNEDSIILIDHHIRNPFRALKLIVRDQAPRTESRVNPSFWRQL
ncbi:MAG TPA: hypothetical protein PKN64_05180 [Casimicrobium sp.]|nr:hypothetical protein [Casimicrobium sp.]